MGYLDNNGLLYFWQKIKAYVSGQIPGSSSTTPAMDGTASTGSETTYARGDHRHPTDTSRAPLASPALTGTPTAPTPSSGDSSTQIATTAFVAAAIASGGVTVDDALSSTSVNPVQNKVIKAALDNVSVADMTGATSSAAGTHGLVPAPAAGKQSSFLRGDGTWAVPDDYQVRTVNTTMNQGYQIALYNGMSTGTATSTLSRNTSIYANPSTGTVNASTFAATTSMTTPTAAAGTNDTTVATTAFVQSAISAAQSGVATFQGAVSAQSTISGSAYKSGWYWVVDTAGTYVGQTCEVGDMIYAIADKGSSYSASDFAVVQANLSITNITNAEIDAIVAQ